MNIKAVIFDLDGVITSSSKEHFLAWAKLALELGGTLSDHIMDDVKGRSRMASLDLVLADIGMADQFSSAQKAELADLKNQYYIDMISKFDARNLEPGATALFEFLKKHGVKIALGSVSKNAPMLLDNMKITGYFDYIVDPAAVKNAKPAPDIFINAADHFGFEHRLCVGIEDAPAGIAAIKSAGMFAVGIGDNELLSEADIVYPALKDVDISSIDHLITKLS
jgi:beta-phosphoglucomutase